MMNRAYFESIIMIERLHRLFLDVIKAELDRMGVRDINNVQCLLLYNIGKKELTVGELTKLGYYLGSNVSYSLQKMVKNQYIIQESSHNDRRSSYVKLSKKGLELFSKFDVILDMHSDYLIESGVSAKNSTNLVNTLRRFENFWTDLLAKT
ncbi:MAG: MarR family transcriptional regulator [Pseudomonadota bacterium]